MREPVAERQVPVREQRAKAGRDRRDARRPRRSPAARAACRRYEPLSPIRSRKRRYSVKQPSAMCWPLSGGGSRIALPLRQRLDGAAERRPRLEQRHVVRRRRRGRAPRRARRARRRRPRPSSARALSPTTRELRRRREPRLLAEDVEAARLDPVERRRGTGRRTSPTQSALRRSSESSSRSPSCEVRARALGLERHQRPPLGVVRPRDVVLGHAERARARPAAGRRGRAPSPRRRRA